MAFNDAELRFKAQLEDNVSPNLQKLEKQLRAAGATDTQIKMTLRAVDEATPKIAAAQKQVEQLPKEKIIKINVEKDRAMSDMRAIRAEADKPIKLTFLSNLKDIGQELFTFRSRVPIMPMAGAVPGASMMYAGGAAMPLTAAVGAGVGALTQGVQQNIEREQSMVTLTQTLKDNTRAQQEMKDVAKFAMKTPFGFSEALQGDVRLRSYQMPTMQGGPGGQGWMGAAGNMAAAMGTPLNQAVEAVADARQGYFVRMMSYGIRMMREDFEKGGKYAGLSYEQGIEKAIRRFDGSMEMQAETFKGVMSNLKDIATERVLIPASQPVFQEMRSRAVDLQDKLLNDPDTLKSIDDNVQKLQQGMMNFYELVKRGKDYFKDYIMAPLAELGEAVAKLAEVFGRAFGGVMIEALTTAAKLLKAVLEPIAAMVEGDGIMARMIRDSLKWYGIMKALSMLPMGQVFEPLGKVLVGNAGPMDLIKTVTNLPRMAMVAGLYRFAQTMGDAADAASKMNRQFKSMDRDTFDKFNADVMSLAHGLGQSTAEMRELVALAAQGIPDNVKNRAGAALQVGKFGAAMDRDFGYDGKEVVRLITAELKRVNDYSGGAQQRAANQVRDLGEAADVLNLTFMDMTRIMGQFGKAAAGVGLGGLAGGPFLGAMSAAMPDAKMGSMLQGYGSPSIDLLRTMSSGETNFRLQNRGHRFESVLPYWDWKNMPAGRINGQVGENGGWDMGSRDFYRDIADTYRANDRSAAQTQARVNRIAPSAQLPDVPNPFRENNMGVRWGWMQKAQNPEERARRGMVELDRQTGFIDNQTSAIADLNNELTKWNNWSTALSQSSDSLNLQMQKLQRSIMPIQQQIERLGTAMAQYSFDNLRPLERQLQRLANENLRLSNSMRVAQYEMGKYTEGLLNGEQAMQDQLYYMERYNKQLQLMQLQYSSIGAQLGQTTFDQGASVRVEPLSQVNLAMQAERLARKSQAAQLTYDLSYGDQRRTLELAGRSRRQSTEMSFEERLAGIKENRGVIDDLSVSQEMLARQQGRVQEAMIPYNEHLADMQDRMTGLNLEVQKATTSDNWQSLQTQMTDVGIASAEAGKQVQYINQQIARQESVMDDAKDAAKRLKDDLVASMFFDDTDPEGIARRMIEQAHRAGTINGQERKRALENIGKVADRIETTQQVAVRTDQKWVDIIKQGVMGGLGDTWRSLGARLQSLGGSARGWGSGLSAIAPWAVPAGAAAVGVGVAGLAARQAVFRPLAAMADNSSWGRALGRWSRGRSERWTERAARLPEGSRRQRFWLSRAANAERLANAPRLFFTGLAGGERFGPALRSQFNLARRAIQAVGTPFAAAAGGALGGPGGAWYAASRYNRFFEDRSVRQAMRDIVKGGADILKTPEKLRDAADDMVKDVKGRQTSFLKNFADKTDDMVKKMRLGRLGRAGRVFAGAAAAFGTVIGGLRGVLEKLPGFKDAARAADKLDDVAKGAGAARAATMARGAGMNQVLEEAGDAMKEGKFAKAMKWLGRAGLVAGVATAGVQASQGNFTGAANSASYLLPYIGPSRIGMDALAAFGNWDQRRQEKQWNSMTDAEKRRQDPHRFEIEQSVDQQRVSIDAAKGAMKRDEWRDPVVGVQTVSERRWKELTKQSLDAMDMTLSKARKVYLRGGDLPQAVEQYFYRAEDLQKGSHRRQQDADDKHNVKLVSNVEKRHRDANRKEQDGYSKIYRTTDEWLDKMKKRINNFRRDMGLTTGGGTGGGNDDPTVTDNDASNDSQHNVGGTDKRTFAHGGFTGKVIKGKGDGRGQLYWAGEEDDELVIPLAPHRRDRAKNLVRQAAGIVGLAGGGAVGRDPAYDVARAVYERAKHMAAGGRIVPIPWAPGEEINSRILPIVTKLHQRFGVGVSDAFDRDRSAGHVSAGHNVTGLAVDFVGSPAQTDALVRWSVQHGLKTLYDGSFGSTAYPDHGPGNHAHIEWPTAGGPVSLGSGTFIGGGVPIPNLGRIPMDKLIGRGIVGNVMAAALKKLRKKLKKNLEGGGGSLGNFAGGGDARANMVLGKKMAAAIGWTGAQWNALRTLWMGESGWRTNADNPTSDAYGIPQAMTNLHNLPADYMTNPATQIKWGLNYIKGRYGSPQGALNFWNSHNPHWYAQGKRRVENDTELAVLHRGERVLNPAEATDTRPLRQAQEAAAEGNKHLKRVVALLTEANDREKNKSRVNLSEINSRLRGNWKGSREGLAGSQYAISTNLRGGEETLAAVRSEQAKAQRAADKYDDTKQGKVDTKLVEVSKNLVRSAESLLKTANTPREKRLARTAVKESRQARTAARRARNRGRQVGYIRGAARRGVNLRVVEQATGRNIRGRTRRLYEKAARARPGSQRQERLLAKLDHRLKNEAAKARAEARREGREARRAVAKAAEAQGKHINRNGKLVKDSSDRVKKSVDKNVDKARDQERELKKGNDNSKGNDRNRSKAEDKADRREREYQKKSLNLLERILQKDTSVNINNHAEGARLTTQVSRPRGRGK